MRSPGSSFGAEEDFIFLCILSELIEEPQPCTSRRHTGQSGSNYVEELLSAAHPRRIQQVLRMNLDTFYCLRDWLKVNTTLQAREGWVIGSSGESDRKYTSIEEKIIIFLYIISRGASNRDTQERFQRSGSTVSSIFHQVLSAVLQLYQAEVVLPTSDDVSTLPSQIEGDPCRDPFFKDCIGALDGTHIDCWVPLSKQAPYRNRKGALSQNVLAVCNFDLLFVYLLPGWEGSAHDGKVLADAQSRHGFDTPKGKYWLGDAGYGNSEFVLSPYRGVRYHLKEQRLANQKPQNPKELFNLRHASLRNAIERIFGVIKRKFKILSRPAEFSFETQVHLILAISGLFNFIRRREGDIERELLEEELEDEDEEESRELANESSESSDNRGDNMMNLKRDEIARQMWVQYQGYIENPQI